MGLIRSPIAGLRAVVSLVALAFASILNASPLWASVLFLATMALVSTAVLGASFGRERARITWAGVAIFGWAYLGAVFGPFRYGNGTTIPPLPTMAMYEYAATESLIPRSRAASQGVTFSNAIRQESL